MSEATEDLKLKLTVTSDEHPELYRVLAAIGNVRRRTRRLKDLASAGLLVERSGGVSISMQPLAAASANEPGPLGDVSELTQWDNKD